MKKVILGIFLFLASVHLSYAQAKLPNAAATTAPKGEQEFLDLF